MLKLNEILEIAKGFSIDSRSVLPGECFIAIKGDNFDGHDFIGQAIQRGAKVIVINIWYQVPSISGTRYKNKVVPGTMRQDKVVFVRVKDTIKALGDLARLNRLKQNKPVIALTGSAGKTTAKEMIARVLSGKFNVLSTEGTKNNHIGLPLTLLKLNKSHDLAVVELGTNHPGEIKYLADIACPDIGLITNIGPCHLKYFGDLAGVLKEKYSLIKNPSGAASAILNADDNLLKKKISASLPGKNIFSFGIKNKGDWTASDIRHSLKGVEFLVNEKYKFYLKALGAGNIYNALAAIAVGRIFGMKYADIQKNLKAFDNPKGRLKLLKIKKTLFIDDTYNANPLSLAYAIAALDNFKTRGRKIFIMGDMLELGDKEKALHLSAGKLAAGVCDIFITVGRLAGLAAQAAVSRGFKIKNTFACGSVREASEILFCRIMPRQDDVVLVKGSRGMKMEEIFK